MQLFPMRQSAQRYRLKRILLGYIWYALCVMTLAFSAWHGMYPRFQLAVFTSGTLAASATFFIIVRLGWNLRFKDPSMAQAQIVCGILLCSYMLIHVGPFRSVFMLSYVIALMFSGTRLTTWQLARLASLPAALFPMVVYIAAYRSPGSIDWRTEFISWIALCAILISTVMMVGNLSRLHKKLKASNAELELALGRLTEMAVRDDLTGLHNRRYMLDMLGHEKSRADRSVDGAFCVCMLDIDHFKRVNDTYGHGDGDTVLRTFAKVVERSIRSADLVARWGGEEFLLLLPQTPLELAVSCVERIKAELENTAFDGLPPELRITISAGAAQYRGEKIKDLIERADQAMYEAKRNGRNRIVTA